MSETTQELAQNELLTDPRFTIGETLYSRWGQTYKYAGVHTDLNDNLERFSYSIVQPGRESVRVGLECLNFVSRAEAKRFLAHHDVDVYPLPTKLLEGSNWLAKGSTCFATAVWNERKLEAEGKTPLEAKVALAVQMILIDRNRI
jgi:hypothetical protein